MEATTTFQMEWLGRIWRRIDGDWFLVEPADLFSLAQPVTSEVQVTQLNGAALRCEVGEDMEATEMTERTFEMEHDGATYCRAMGEWFEVSRHPEGGPDYQLVEDAGLVATLDAAATEDGYL